MNFGPDAENRIVFNSDAADTATQFNQGITPFRLPESTVFRLEVKSDSVSLGGEGTTPWLQYVSGVRTEIELATRGLNTFSGNQVMNNSLSVGGDITVTGDITTTDAAVAGNLGVDGTTVLGGALEVTGASTLTGDVTTAGLQTFTNETKESLTLSTLDNSTSEIGITWTNQGGNHTATLYRDIDNGVNDTDMVMAVGGDADIDLLTESQRWFNDGSVTFSGNVGVAGTSSLIGDVTASGDVTVTGDITATDAAIAGNLGVDGTTVLGGALDVTGVSTLTGNVAASADLAVTGDITADGGNIVFHEGNRPLLLPFNGYIVGSTDYPAAALTTELLVTFEDREIYTVNGLGTATVTMPTIADFGTVTTLDTEVNDGATFVIYNYGTQEITLAQPGTDTEYFFLLSDGSLSHADFVIAQGIKAEFRALDPAPSGVGTQKFWMIHTS
jgi:hypothetical protein